MTGPGSTPAQATLGRPLRSEWAYVAAFVVAAIVIAGGTWLLVEHERSSALEHWEARQSGIADVMAARVSDWLNERHADAEVLAAAPTVYAALSGTLGVPTAFRAELRQRFIAYLAHAAVSHHYQGIYVLDPAGHVIAQSPNAPPLEAATTAVAQAVARERSSRVDLFGGIPELSVASFTAPIWDRPDDPAVGGAHLGSVVGFVMLTTALADTLFPLLGDTVPTDTGETLLVRRDGDDMVFINPLRHRPARSRQLRVPFETSSRLPAWWALTGRTAVMEAADYRGTIVLAATRFLPTTGWGLVRKIDLDEALTGFRATARFEMLAAGFLIVAFATLLRSQWQHQRTHVLREMMAASEARLRLASIVESSDDAIIGMTLDGAITTWNAGAQRLYGYRPEEVIGQPISLLVPPNHAGEPSILDTMKRGERVMRLETVHLRKEGQPVDVSLTVSPIVSNTGTIVGASAIARDVTERKRAEDALQRTAADLARSNAELQQFAYVASHDLQEPLRMVASYVELLARRYKGQLDADADEFIGYAVDGALRMQRLISDLLSYARVGTRGKEFAPADCERVLNEVLANLQETISANGAVVTHDPLPTVMGDEVQLAQLLQNLIGNGIKFRGEAPPHVHVAARRQDTSWLFSVRDNGIGIEAQHFDRIFVIFQRLHGRDEYPGTGIGLAVCKRIVARHGGRIWVDSEPGKGSTFFFTIPDAGGH